MELKDAVAIVTGSSSGIGAAIAQQLAAKGCRVTINYSQNAEGARVVADQCAALGGETLIQRADVAEDADCRALVTMTLSLARVLGPQIRVNAVCPGFVAGEWLKKGLGEEVYEAIRKQYADIAPLKATATPDTVAQTVLSLVAGADWITGETLIVDGGAHLHTAPPMGISAKGDIQRSHRFWTPTSARVA
ncbi:MAG: SDR family oxidoreductase, partial [Desulfatitalea sp.]